MAETQSRTEVVEAAQKACATTREWATLAIEAAEPLIRKQLLDEERQRLIQPIGRVQGALDLLRDEDRFPEFNRRGLVEVLDELLAALNPDPPETQGGDASERSVPEARGQSPHVTRPGAGESGSLPETLRRWTIWQPDDDEEIPPSPGPMVMRVYAGPTLKPGERLDLVSLPELEELLTGDEAVEAGEDALGEVYDRNEGTAMTSELVPAVLQAAVASIEGQRRG